MANEVIQGCAEDEHLCIHPAQGSVNSCREDRVCIMTTRVMQWCAEDQHL